MTSTCRILVTDEVPDLAGTSYLGPDGTVWIVVSPQAQNPCQLLAELVSDAFDGGLPEVLIYERAYGGSPPEPAGQVRRAVTAAGGERRVLDEHRPMRLADDGTGDLHAEVVDDESAPDAGT